MDVSFLTKKDIENIEWWFTYKKECPWGDSAPNTGTVGCSECESLFPDMPGGDCPCPYFGKEEVTRIAKQIVKQWREENGS